MNSVLVKGAKSLYKGDDLARFQEVMSVPAKGAETSAAFIEGRWNGRNPLYTGRAFPTGLLQRLVSGFAASGVPLEVVDEDPAPDIDTGEMTHEYSRAFFPYALWDHQLECILALLHAKRGVVRSPTASGKTLMAYCVARYLRDYYDLRSMILTPKAGVAKQTWKEFNSWTNGDFEVGYVAEGERNFQDITVATAQTMQHFQGVGEMEADEDLADYLQSVDVLIFDECHHSSADSWYDIALACPAAYRFGFSGTPIVEEDEADARLIGALGPIVYHIPTRLLMDLGIVAEPRIVMVMDEHATGPYTLQHEIQRAMLKGKNGAEKYRIAYDLGVVLNDYLNTAVVQSAEWLAKRGRCVLILTRRKEQFLRIAEKLESETKLRYAALWGEDNTDLREEVKDMLKAGELDVLLATTIFDEGEDVPRINGLVLAEGVKKVTNVLQRIGRGMRRDDDDNQVWVVDFVPLCSSNLAEHALKRTILYEGEDYAVLVQDKWPKPGDSTDALLPFEDWENAIRTG